MGKTRGRTRGRRTRGKRTRCKSKRIQHGGGYYPQRPHILANNIRTQVKYFKDSHPIIAGHR